jgi:hypothetical protein
MSQNSKENSDSYLGKVRSNFLGTEFLVFDSGDSHKIAFKQNQQRKCLGGILYAIFKNLRNKTYSAPKARAK